MGSLRILLRKNYWTTGALLIAMLLWIGGGPALSTVGRLTSAPVKSEASTPSDADGGTSDPEDDRTVLSSLEAVVAPVAKLQVALLGGFAPPRVVHETVAPVRITLPTPQNNYFRTLFRLITPANAP
ncbi:MAG: hypothetical protein WA960_07470 [Tunicatimonas sp.]